MNQAARSAAPGARTRRQSFRSAFRLAFAQRIGDYMSERFGDLQEGTVRSGYDGAGWAGGRIDADSAQLSFAGLSADPGHA